MNRNNTVKITFMAISIGLNILGGFIAVALKLPIFMDTIGTFLIAFLFGPLSGAITGFATSMINGFTFDPYSLYFFPVQVIIGVTAGLCYKKGLFKGKLTVLGVLISTISGSLVASLIAAYVFGGITSSGTTFMVIYFKNVGVNIVASVFSTQILFDLLDKATTIFLVLTLIKSLPNNMKETIKNRCING